MPWRATKETVKDRGAWGTAVHGVAESDMTEVTARTHVGILWAMVNNTVCVSAEYFYREKVSVMWLVTGSR